MENQPCAGRIQDEFRREVESARPRYLVFVGVPMSWGTRADSDTLLLTWANEFTARCYEPAGVVDIDPAGEARVRWDTDSRVSRPRFSAQVWTFKRTEAAGCTSPG